ncbi:MAG: hypothetical protein GX365_06630 [Clostridiales bacterium]|jgi:hypothetical protein|nr:hypothetical protein [Clostridiales bacterium]
MNITYEELKELLLIGHEIEFEYNKKKYSINCGQDYWYLTEYYNKNQEFKTTEELLEKGKVRGENIKQIWDDVEVIAVY